MRASCDGRDFLPCRQRKSRNCATVPNRIDLPSTAHPQWFVVISSEKSIRKSRRGSCQTAFGQVFLPKRWDNILYRDKQCQ